MVHPAELECRLQHSQLMTHSYNLPTDKQKKNKNKMNKKGRSQTRLNSDILEHNFIASLLRERGYVTHTHTHTYI